MIKYVVFDFDGTLVDSLGLIKRLVQAELKISDKEFETIREVGLKQAVKKLDISSIKVASLAFKISLKLKRKTDKIKFFPGMVEVIKTLTADYKLGIVSSNTKEIITQVLTRNRIEDCFEFIYSDSSFFGKHLVLKRMCQKLEIKPLEVVYIGDEDRDILAAKKVKIKNMSVSWGFNSKKRLRQTTPDFLVDLPEEIIKNISKY